MVTFAIGIQAEAVIFDFDGIIVDTEPLHYQAFQKILEPIGLGFTWQDYRSTYMGFDDRDAFRESFASRGLPIEQDYLNSLIDTKADVFQEIIRSGVTAYPGVIELITTLHSAGVPMAICSGALRTDILPILEMFGIKKCFQVIVSADDVTKSKPDPECYRLSFNKLSASRGLKLAERYCIAIEDTPAGISAATQAGLLVVAVTNSYPEEHLVSATHIISSLEELLDLDMTR